MNGLWLDQLAGEHYLEARKFLEQGIKNNDLSPELNRDMDTILSSMPANGNSLGKLDTDSVAGQAWLNSYTKNND